MRGYRVGEFLGDHGYQVSAELRGGILGYKGYREKMQGVIFLDNGAVLNKTVQSGERRRHALTGYGLGLRVRPADFLQVQVDVGFPASRWSPLEDRTQKGPTVYVQGAMRF